MTLPKPDQDARRAAVSLATTYIAVKDAPPYAPAAFLAITKKITVFLQLGNIDVRRQALVLALGYAASTAPVATRTIDDVLNMADKISLYITEGL